MTHHWLISWTCYGHWLPGDARGFVGNVRDKEDRTQVVHNIPGTPYDANMPRLEAWVRARMKGSKRKLPDDAATWAAVIYVVKKQPNPLMVWHAPRWQDALDDWEKRNSLLKK